MTTRWVSRHLSGAQWLRSCRAITGIGDAALAAIDDPTTGVKNYAAGHRVPHFDLSTDLIAKRPAEVFAPQLRTDAGAAGGTTGSGSVTTMPMPHGMSAIQ